jgi:hypothetical protein
MDVHHREPRPPQVSPSVTRRDFRYTIKGAAWGAPIAAVEVQIDRGPWMAARLFGPPPPTKKSHGFAWRFWTFCGSDTVRGTRLECHQTGLPS